MFTVFYRLEKGFFPGDFRVFPRYTAKKALCS